MSLMDHATRSAADRWLGSARLGVWPGWGVAWDPSVSDEPAAGLHIFIGADRPRKRHFLILFVETGLKHDPVKMIQRRILM